MMPAVARDLDETVAGRLRAVGQRYTPQRGALVATLARARKPLSTAEIVETRTGPQSSVYRNLAVLEHAGVVRRVIAEGGFARFELAEALTEHHHHLICSSCGKVEDVTIPPDLETTMDRTVDRLAKRSGFASVRHRLDLIGTCRACASSALRA
jgi:Fur family ferric uptake transcriptional regulator